MRRTEFLEELERLLADLPEEERKAAIQYYDDYLQDAGQENEQEVIRELGGPEKAAATIRADYYGREFHEEEYDTKDYMAQCQNGNSGGTDRDSGGAAEQKAPWTSRKLKLLLIVLILLTVIPGILGGTGTAVCVVIGIVCAVIGIGAGLVVGAAALMIAGAAVTVVGDGLFFDVAPMAFLVCGIGLLLFVVGLIAAAGAVKLCAVVYPAMLRGFVNLCRKPFQRREAQ